MVESKTVCVTGASGFIGCYIVKELLLRGYKVRGTVRDANSARNAHLWALAEGLPGALELFSADLGIERSFDTAVSGCEFVCHVASPVVMKSKQPQKEIVDPAVNGTINVLESILRAKCARRVVMTSSRAAAVFGRSDPAHVYTEKDWNSVTDLEVAAYPVSKTLAEKAAWRIYEEQPTVGWRFELVTMLPGVALGPVFWKQHLHTSPQVILHLMNGTMPMAPDIDWEYVDVRDVAIAHVNALENEAASGRYLLLNGNCTFLETAAIIKQKYPHGYFLPRCLAPRWVVYILSMLNQTEVSWPFLKQVMGVRTTFSNEKARVELGVTFRPMEESILDTADSLVQSNFVKKSIFPFV